MARRTEKPFDKIVTVRARLRSYIEYGDLALGGKTPQELAEDVSECFEWLMEFRNIINGMVSFDQTPSQAVVPYLNDDVLKNAVETIDG